MKLNRTEKEDCMEVAVLLDLSATEVVRAVQSFFDAILMDAKKLPFDDERRIYYQELFNDYVKVYGIPSIGRIGPVYSRYLKWRENDAKASGQVDRRAYHRSKRAEDMEEVARAVLAGKELPEIKKRKGNELYNRVWLVGKNGKKLARQALPKIEK